MLFTILPLILVLFPQKTGSKPWFLQCFAASFIIYYKIGGVFTDSWLETMVSAIFLQLFSPYFDVDLKESSWFSQKPPKTHGFFID